MADTPVSPPSQTLPTAAPNRATATDPAAYSAVADAWAGSLPNYNSYLLSLGANVKFNADSAFDSAGEAAVSATTANGYLADAEAAATAAAGSANLRGAWADQTGAAAPPYSVTHEGRIWVLLNSLADVTASEPGVTADWQSVGTLLVQTRTTNTILGADDYGATIRYTGSGGFTQTFQDANSMGEGWYVYLKNDTTGDITLDPNGSEQISGLASFVMYPGEMRIIILNAAKDGYDSFVLNAFRKIFDSSGTFTLPPGYICVDVTTIGAGNSGEKSSGGNKASGGGGGGAISRRFPKGDVGATETVTVGAGGAAVSASSTAGNVGGASSFGSLLATVVSSDPKNGAAGTSNAAGGIIYGETVSAASPPSRPNAGGASSDDGTAASSGSIFGGGAGGSVGAAGAIRAPGASQFAGSGGAALASDSGASGTAPGGGGGATQTGANSGAGANGRVIVEGVL